MEAVAWAMMTAGAGRRQHGAGRTSDQGGGRGRGSTWGRWRRGPDLNNSSKVGTVMGGVSGACPGASGKLIHLADVQPGSVPSASPTAMTDNRIQTPDWSS